MQFIIRADQPFAGHCQSVLLDDGTVAYSGGLTLEQYQAERGGSYKVVTSEELETLERDYIKSRITQPREITKERYWDMLECLPPSRWHTSRGVELFHICERITANLVSWFAHVGGRYFEFEDVSSADSEELAAKVAKAL